jgi:hypothetical protein
MPLKRRKAEKAVDSRSDSGITALIDYDVIVYSCGFAAQKNIHEVTINGEDKPRASFNYKKELKEWVKQNDLSDCDYSVHTVVEADSVENTLHSVKVFLNGILEATNAQYYKGYLTGKGNFREDLATILPYKGNRSAPKPVHYDLIREYLVNHWDAVVVEGFEADDAMAIEQMKDYNSFALPGNKPCNTVICSIDKDLMMIPGKHYNWNKDEEPVWVSEKEGMYNFYKQLLTGDRVDNIPGIPGIGDKKAEKILEGCETEVEMYEACLRAYQESPDTSKTSPPGRAADVLLENAQLLWMVRALDEDGNPVMWEPPV